MNKVMKVLVAALAAAAAVGSVQLASARTGATSSTPRAVLALHKGKLGRFVVDAHGRTLYLFEKDKHGRSSCYGTCAKVWSPYLTKGRPSARAGLASEKIGTTKRRDGTTQVTYAGHPLYRYDDDHRAGQTKGEGSKEFGAEWYVVAPSGEKIDKE